MPNELLIRVVLHAGVIPGAISLVLLGLLWWRHTRSADRAKAEGRLTGRPPRWAVPLLMTLAVLVSIWVVEQSFELWPRSNTRRFYHAAALIGLIATVEGLASWPLVLRVIARAAAFAGATWMLTEGYRPGVLSDAQLWLLVGAAGVAGAALATLADRGLSRAKPDRNTGWTAPLAAVILTTAVQPFLHFAGYSSGSLMLVGPLAVLSAALLVGVRFKRLDLSAGTATVLVGLVLMGLLGAGVQSEPKSIPALLLIAASPLALAIRFRGPLPTLAIRAAAVGVFIAPAMGLLMAKPAPPPAEDDPYADYYPE